MLGKDINSATVYYFLKTLMFYTGQYSESRDYFQKAILADPLLIDAYIERGYEALVVAANPQSGLDKDKALLLDQALSFFDLAYTIKPDSAEALNGLALTSLYMKKNDDAMKWAQGAVGAGPEFPWTHFTLAAVLNAKGDYRGAVKEVDKGGELDKVVLQGRGVPSADEAWLYTYRFARVPVIMLTK
jgi:tetratricopeptide (TPR) repeat protein